MSVFVSMVGMQSMAVASPVRTLLQRELIPKPVWVYLLHTSKTASTSQRIEGYLRAKCGDINIVSKEISMLLTDAKSPQNVLKEIVKRHEGEMLFFNIAGAMNYQISACIYTLQYLNTVYVYPESEGIWLVQFSKDSGVTIKKETPTVEEDFDAYLRLQGIKVKKNQKFKDDKQAESIIGRLKDLGLAHTSCIRYDYGVSIKDVSFDFLLNSLNELIFVYVNKNAKTDEIRKVINLATNRKDFGELLHHKTVVVTSNKLVKNRLTSEAGGKVLVVDLKEDVNPFAQAMAKRVGEIRLAVEHVQTGKEVNSEKSLYVSLGEDVLPTLVAIYSHKPKKLGLLYTPMDETVKKYKDAFVENKDILPCSELVLIPTDITGMSILEYKPEANEQIECNITPGTKAQGACLSLFANRHGGTVWSIRQDAEGSIEQLPEGLRQPAVTPSIDTVLRIKGHKGYSIKDFDDKQGHFFTAVEDFLKSIKDDPVLFKAFPQGNFTSPDRQVAYENWTITLNGKSYQIRHNSGAWFESFTAWALKKAGATEIALNYTEPWPAEIEASIRYKNPHYSQVYRTEIDILAIYANKYLVVSCKSGHTETKRKAVSDLKGTTAILGRFAIPLLAYFRHRGEPKVVDGVYVFGVDTLCDAQKMQTLLDNAIRARRTTVQ